jgi:hypothetical protein
MLRGLVRAADPLIAYLIQAAARCIAARGLPASETS